MLAVRNPFSCYISILYIMRLKTRLRGGCLWSFSRTFEQVQLPLSLRHSRPRHPCILFSKWNCRVQCFISNASRLSTRGNKTAKLVATWKSRNGETFGIIVAGITIHSAGLAEPALLHKVDQKNTPSGSPGLSNLSWCAQTTRIATSC